MRRSLLETQHNPGFPASSKPDFSLLVKQKVANLRKGFLSRSDKEKLTSRLCFIWHVSSETETETVKTHSTVWRHSRTRRNYQDIQDESNHLFLAFVLVATPTECARTGFEQHIQQIFVEHNLSDYLFDLNNEALQFFESTAAEQGYASNHRYIMFRRALFPKQEFREIQYAYSLVSRNDIDTFVKTMLQGVQRSTLWKNEEGEGGSLSGCLTIFIPTNEDEDGSCTMRVDRNVLMQAIHGFRLTKLNLA